MEWEICAIQEDPFYFHGALFWVDIHAEGVVECLLTTLKERCYGFVCFFSQPAKSLLACLVCVHEVALFQYAYGVTCGVKWPVMVRLF